MMPYGRALQSLSSLILLIITILCGYPVLTDSDSAANQCGKLLPRANTRGKLSGKIVGGYEVGYLKYPWFAALQYDGDTLCGGALIGPNVVLTAAHCFDAFIDHGHGRKPEDAFTVKLGVYNQCKNEPTQSMYKTIKVDIHEKYKDNKPYYDIALLTLSGDASKYTPICLPPKDNEQELEAKIIGFGAMFDGGPNAYPCEMREGRVLLYDNATCVDMMKKHTGMPKEYAFTNAICAGYKSGGVDSCSGDSGGPLMTVDQTTNTWKTVGITSFGWGCGEKNAMGIYTDVSKYLDWIQEKSGIKPTDTSNLHNHESNAFADAINKLYDEMMNSTHRPEEIVIHL